MLRQTTWRVRGIWVVAILVSTVWTSSCEKPRSENSNSDSREPSPASRASNQPGRKPDTNGGKQREVRKVSSGAKAPEDLQEGTRRQRKLLSKAKAHFLNDDLERAEPIFEELVDRGPMTGARASAYIALGQLYLRTDRPVRAVELLESMPSPGERVVEARLVLARAYARAGDKKEAIREYRRVTELQRNYLFAYPPLGSLYVRTGQKKKAAKTYLEYENRLETLARALEDPSTSRPVKRMNILEIFSAVDDERAVEAVRAALNDPNPRVRARAASTSAALRIVSARETVEKLAEKDPAKLVRKKAKSALKRLRNVRAPPSRTTGFPDEAKKP